VCCLDEGESIRDMVLRTSFKVIVLSLALLMIIPFERRADGSGGMTLEQYKNAEILNEVSRKKIIAGFWNFGFPVSACVYGYIFTNDGKFIYFNDKESGYKGTSGIWKETNYRLYVKPEKDLFFGSESSYALRSSYKDWILVSDLRSYDWYWYPAQEDDSSYPPSISIKIFKDGMITHYVQRYFKLTDSSSVKKNHAHIIDLFEKTIIQ
jgi:hypothetical protein